MSTANKKGEPKFSLMIHGALDRIRTCGTLLRRQVLYPLSYGGRFSEHVLALAVMSIRIIVQDRVAANKEHAD